MLRRKIIRTALVVLFIFVAFGSARADEGRSDSRPTVSLALVLAADVSSSINQERFRLQREGYAQALTNPNVLRAIRDSSERRIAITYFEWAGFGSQRVIIPWTVLSNADEAEAMAERLVNVPRPFGGSTSISGAIDYAVDLLEASPYRDVRRVIDISGDGVNNEGRSASAARDDALVRGIIINGLVIMPEQQSQGRNAWRPANEPPLDEFYRDNVIGGLGAFVIAINNFDVFGYTIVNKLVLEIADGSDDRVESPRYAWLTDLAR
jgi:hypothetical protein